MKNALRFNQPLVLGNFAADPAGAVKGVIYFNTTTNKFRVYNGSAWDDVASGTISPVFTTDLFRLQDSTDNTKQIAFDATGITSGQIRSILMPDYDVNLADIATKANALDVIMKDGSVAMTGDFDFGNFKGINAIDPTSAQDVATKAYVDSIAAGLDPKGSVRVATTADLASTYATSPSNGRFTSTPDTIDDILLSIGDRVLVKNQIDPKQNGIYIYDAANQLTRASDMDGLPTAEVSAGNFTYVESGTVNTGVAYVITGSGVITLNTDNVNWTVFSSAGGGANKFLNNLTAPTAINQSLLPGTDNLVNLGGFNNRWAAIYATGLFAYNDNNSAIGIFGKTDSNKYIRLYSDASNLSTLSSGRQVRSLIEQSDATGAQSGLGIKTVISGSGASGLISIETGNQISTSGSSGAIYSQTGAITNISNSSATGGISLITGDNAGTGNSGSITLKTGTAGGTRGAVIVDSLVLAAVSDNTVDIGSSSSRFKTAYANNLNVMAGAGAVGITNFDSLFGTTLFSGTGGNSGSIYGTAAAAAGIALYSETKNLVVAANLDVDILSKTGSVNISGASAIFKTSSIDANNNTIKNLLDPSNAQEAATKNYVDGAVGAIDLTPYVKKDGTVAMTGNLVPAADNGTSIGTSTLSFATVVANRFSPGAATISTTGDVASGSAVITNMGTTVGITNSMEIIHPAFPRGTFVNSVDSGTQITVSNNATANATGASLFFAIMLNARSQNAAVNAASASAYFRSGSVSGATASSGAVFVRSGDGSSGATTGDVTVSTGTTSGTRGSVYIEGNYLELASQTMTLAPLAALKRATYAAKSSFVEEQYVHSVAIAASQTNTVITEFTFAHATYQAVEITYTMKDSAGNVRVGTMRVVSNGTDVSLTDVSADTTDLGIDFSAVVSGSNVNIRYTSGANTATLRSDVKRFLV